MSAAVARAGVRMPATRVPGVRDLRCDAKGGDSFQCSAYRVSCRVRAGGSEGLPYGRSLREWADSPQVSVGPRLRLPRRAAMDSAGAARSGEVRRRGTSGPDRTVANWCGACEG
ncbi:hypothetical protein GCM10019016_068550 [Streptomyces prasinosporus]|uniref:Uncharacterized protein n=1 Tax=Streptomyces prasinosporus TaxID=68256 RepID=A0ABP6U0A8_9ACTN|nr:hypothetical protein GCM10010332_31460 [Streptomyces albogriseolus]